MRSLAAQTDKFLTDNQHLFPLFHCLLAFATGKVILGSPSIKKNLPEQSRTWHPESAGPTERRHDHGLFNLVMHIVNWLLWNSHFLCSSLLWTPAQRGSKWQQQQYLVFGPIRCYRARRWTNLPAQPAQPQCSNHWSPLHWQIIATNSKAHGKRPAIHEAISKIDLSFSIYYLCVNLWMRYL